MGVWRCVLITWCLGVETGIVRWVLRKKGAALGIGVHEGGVVARGRLRVVEGIPARVLGGIAGILLRCAAHLRRIRMRLVQRVVCDSRALILRVRCPLRLRPNRRRVDRPLRAGGWRIKSTLLLPCTKERRSMR